jgi:hypothetical protein
VARTPQAKRASLDAGARCWPDCAWAEQAGLDTGAHHAPSLARLAGAEPRASVR